MDFSNRNTQPQTAAPSAHTAAPGPAHRKKRDRDKWNRIGVAVIGGIVILLIIAVVAFIGFGGPKSEDSYVDTSKLQAVFLNTGQVYFGNIKSLNNKYFVLTNIYYLQATNNGNSSNSNSSANSASNVTLVKLGCELHEPYDQMVINSDQVTFWENLQDGGQVAKAVSTFEKQNPNGQKCADQSSSAGTNSTNATQNAASNNGSSTPSTDNSSSTKPTGTGSQ